MLAAPVTGRSTGADPLRSPVMSTTLIFLAALAMPWSCLAAPPDPSEPEAVVRACADAASRNALETVDELTTYEVEDGRTVHLVYVERLARDPEQ